MKYIKQIFERLSRGGFISSDSTQEEMKQLFIDIEDNLMAYRQYYKEIGFLLEEGNGYFYFSRQESKTQLMDKLVRLGHWIDILDFLKAWEPIFGPGYTFSKATLTIKAEADIDLQQKASGLYEKKDNLPDIVEKLVEEMQKAGFLELTNEKTGQYRVVAAYGYLEDLVNQKLMQTCSVSFPSWMYYTIKLSSFFIQKPKSRYGEFFR